MRYIALGDSSGVGFGADDGHGYVDRLAQRMSAGSAEPTIELTNLCISGATARDVLAREVPRLRGTEPTLVTLLVGVNDIWRMTDETGFARTFRDIADGMKREWMRTPDIVAVATMPEMSQAPAASLVEKQFGIPRSVIAARVQSFNAIIAEVVKDSGFALVDLGKESITGRDDLFSADGFHPSSAGYQHMAEVFHEVIVGTLAPGRTG